MSESTPPAKVTRQYRFAAIPEWVLYHPELSPLAVRIFGILDRRGQNPSNCYPSHAWIAGKAGVSTRTVGRMLEELEAVGAIRSIHRSRKDAGGRTSDAYWVAGDGPLPPLTRHDWQESESVDEASGHECQVGEPAAVASGHACHSYTPSVSGSNTTPVSKEKEEPVEREPLNEKTLALVLADSSPVADFEAFWTVYPRKVAKGAARKAWKTATSKERADVIVAAARDYAEWTKSDDPKFTAHPATWLNGERWTDEPPPLPVDPKLAILANFAASNQ